MAISIKITQSYAPIGTIPPLSMNFVGKQVSCILKRALLHLVIPLLQLFDWLNLMLKFLILNRAKI